MQSDEFERLLQRQPMREVPAEWRDEILAGCAQSASRVTPHASRPVPGWREWLWPCPQAWAGMAAIWGVSLALQLSAGGTAVSSADQHAASAPAPGMGFAERRQLLTQLLGSAGAVAPPPVDAPKKSVPRPQSSRHEPWAMA